MLKGSKTFLISENEELDNFHSVSSDFIRDFLSATKFSLDLIDANLQIFLIAHQCQIFLLSKDS